VSASLATMRMSESATARLRRLVKRLEHELGSCCETLEEANEIELKLERLGERYGRQACGWEP
jgi:hypothetical protein